MRNNSHCSRHGYFFAVVFFLSIATPANAALVSRLGGQAVYDTDLDITWTANANINGMMTWAAANTWTTNLVIDGVSGWRLPTTLQPDASCSEQDIGESWGYGCTGSEMGHLFYNELGGVAGSSILTTHNANLALFQNVQFDYWSGTEYAPITIGAWSYTFDSGRGSGYQNAIDKGVGLYAWAVHPGDVAAVPIPTAFWLFGSGLVGLFGFMRRRNNKINH
jgi:hypothetical protein